MEMIDIEQTRPLVKTLLLVEDEALIALAEKHQLSAAGYRVIHVTSGERAVETMKAQGHEIDLILMDIDLGPGIDGTEAAEQILASWQVPLVFLSSHTEHEVVDKTERITSYGYVVKNSGEVVLLASLRMAFRLFEANRNLAREKTRAEAMNEELRVSNDDLRASNERLEWWHDLMRYVIGHDPGAVAILDDRLHFMYVSERFLSDYRVTEETVVGRHHYEVFPEIPEKWRAVHRQALQGEALRCDHDTFERLDGTVDRTRWECRPWYQPDGSVGGIILYTQVIDTHMQNDDGPVTAVE